MKDWFGWCSVFVLLMFLASSVSSCGHSYNYGTMKPLVTEHQWLKCQAQKQVGEKCQRYPYWKKLSKSRLALND